MRKYSRKKRIVAINRAKRFIKKVLGKIEPRNKSFSVCFPLSIYLDSYNIKNKIIGCIYHHKNRAFPHFYLQIESINFAIDPAIRHFNNKGSRIYFGPPTPNYIDKEYRFDDTYAIWKKGLTDPNYLRERRLKFAEFEKIYNRALRMLSLTADTGKLKLYHIQ